MMESFLSCPDSQTPQPLACLRLPLSGQRLPRNFSEFCGRGVGCGWNFALDRDNELKCEASLIVEQIAVAQQSGSRYLGTGTGQLGPTGILVV